MSSTTRPGKGLPWAAFTLGAAGSLAANLIDAYEAAARVGLAHSVPDVTAALFFAMIVPVALLLVGEMLIRSGSAETGKVLAAVMWVGAAAVAGGAAVMSFSHMYKVMLSYGQPVYVAALMPLAVDGLMLVASVALARAGRAAAPVAVPDDVPTNGTQDMPDPVAVPDDVVSSVPEAASVPEQDAATVPDPVPSVPDPLPLAVPGEDVPETDAVPSVPVLTAVPDIVPDVPRSEGDPRTLAETEAREALRAGRKITGKALGELFGKSERWGRQRIAAAKRDLADSAA